MDGLKFYGKSKNNLEFPVKMVRMFTEDENMKFRTWKCATIVMKRGRKVEDEGIELPD